MIEAFKYRIPVTYFLKIQGLDLVLSDGSNISGSSQEFCPALRIKDQAIGHSVEPLAVVGQGRALEITLDADALKASGYLDQYFSPPSVIATLNTDEITRTTSSFALDDASGFAAGGGVAYWGLEKLAYASRTSSGATQTLNTVTRDSTGTAFNFAQASPRGLSGVWSAVSDRPLLWTGRLVELWGVATTPEGELLGTPFSTSGMTSGASRLWVGYISEQPTITTTGINLRALPAERLIDREYGHQQTWATAWKSTPNYGTWNQPFFWPQGGRLRMTLITVDDAVHSSSIEPVDTAHGSTIAANSNKRIITPIQAWDHCREAWESALSTSTGDTITITFTMQESDSGDPRVLLKVATDGTPYLKACQISTELAASTMNVGTETGPAVQSVMPTGVNLAIIGQHVTQEYNPPIFSSVAQSGGFPIEDPISAADSQFAGIPVAGQSISWKQSLLMGYDHTFTAKIAEVIAWKSLTGSNASYWLRVTPSPEADQFSASQLTQHITDISELSEALLIQGSADADGAEALALGDLWLQLLCSSGAGSKSTTYDLHPHGWGAGIPEDWIAFTASSFSDFAALDQFVAYDEIDAQNIYIDALAEERAFSQTLVNQIAKVDAVDLTQPREGETLVELTPSDLLAEPVQAGVMSAPPNVVIFEFLNASLPRVVQRDALRIAAEGGVNSLELSVPAQWYYDGTSGKPGGSSKLGTVASSILRGPFFGHVYMFTLSLCSEHWASVNVGDAVRVTGEHYAWVNLAAAQPGHRASSITGRCTGKECKLDGSGVQITIAVWPNTAPQVYSPDSEFTLSSTTITLPAGRVDWFVTSEREDVTFYKPGEESTKLETRTIDSSTGNDIAFLSVPSWAGESGVRITFAPTASASDRQKLFAHVSDGGIML